MERDIQLPVQGVEQALAAAGWDVQNEMSALAQTGNGFDLPMLRIEHRENGEHRLYIDHGESYLPQAETSEDVPGNMLTGIVFAVESIRALWMHGETTPLCSALDNKPTVDEPLSSSCHSCKESVIGGRCKPKMRLWMLVLVEGEWRPIVFNLSPTSLKHWNGHIQRLSRSRLPLVAVRTVVSLQDVKKNNYRWAEAIFSMDGLADAFELRKAKAALDEFNEFRQVISGRDFVEPGDKLD